MNRSRENLPVTIFADWHSPIISATIYLKGRRSRLNYRGRYHAWKNTVRRFRFQLRNLLIAVAIFAVGLSWLSYRKQLGSDQLQAANSLREQGILAIQDRQISEISNFVLPGPNRSSKTVEIPMVKALDPEDDGWLRKILGESICTCLLYTSPSPRDGLLSRMPSSA